MNSTPSSPLATIRLTALLPPAAHADDFDFRAEPRFGIERQPQPVRVFAAGIALPHVNLRQKNSLNMPRSRTFMRPNAPAPARAGSGARLRCA